MEQPEANPTFCTNNCGFYGSSQFEGMCSKCFRDTVNRSYNTGRPNSCTNSFYSPSNLLPTEEITPSLIEKDNSEDASQTTNSISQLSHVESAPVISTTIENENSSMNDSDLIASRSLDTSLCSLTTTPEKKKRNRCSWETCNKKLGLTGFDCRCGGQYCSLHRYANEHKCTFDYKEHGQNEIRKNMPVVQGERVRKI